jgi:hypothetical protein
MNEPNLGEILATTLNRKVEVPKNNHTRVYVYLRSAYEDAFSRQIVGLDDSNVRMRYYEQNLIRHVATALDLLGYDVVKREG